MPCRIYQKASILKRQRRNRNHRRIKKFGFSKAERLSSKKEIKRLFSKGKRFSRGNLTIIYRPGNERKTGFVASMKIGGAIKRNRVKRILREAFRMNKEIFMGLETIFYAQGPLDFNSAVTIIESFKEGR